MSRTNLEVQGGDCVSAGVGFSSYIAGMLPATPKGVRHLVTSRDARWQHLAAGIEPAYSVSEVPTEKQVTASAGKVSALCLHGNGNACQYMACLDPALPRLIEVWPSISMDARQTIHAICLDALLLDDE